MVESTLVSEQAISAEANFQIAGLIKYWGDAGPRRWFGKDAEFDADFRQRYLDLHLGAAARRFDLWLESAYGTLALMLLLDQFPRNAFRGTAHAYATDPLARSFAEYALERGHDLEVTRDLRLFFYLPFAHSEEIAHQKLSLVLHGRVGNLAQATVRHDVICRFGRFPHRNAILLRITTPEEQAFLNTGGFAG